MVQQNKSKLKIHPEPFKPSHLSIPPSPFSPRTPLININTRPPTHRTKTYPPPDTTAAPPAPLQWLWQCHQCHRSYSLGVTRRCLEDGHHFCAGTTTVKTWRKPLRPKKMKKHRACASEFDYLGWKNWGRWRRSGRKDSIYDEDSSSSSTSTSSSTSLSSSEPNNPPNPQPSPPPPLPPLSQKDCWNACDYPSECRWGKRFGVHTPVTTTFPTFDIVPASALAGVDTPTTADPAAPAVTPATVEGVLNPENYSEPNGSNAEKKSSKADLWDALVASATRRKSVPPSSPLASVSEEVEGGGGGEVERDRDGDVVMGSSADIEQSSASSALSSLKDVFRKSSKMYSKSVRRAIETKGTTTADVENGVEELAPLQRVQSRDSGYHSNP
ncbi:hypothetical protein DM02DRAFT_86864 [Periconia macrospinosa]|uniref:Uncharacterized protein n=1 Tax=Periconia macrospinosa TaxID=97972 RepID=A0A2V1DGW6_9PLEO|nr:hypothetical protein DM02DRAFT_86864 [Periconia macrospinosa]